VRRRRVKLLGGSVIRSCAMTSLLHVFSYIWKTFVVSIFLLSLGPKNLLGLIQGFVTRKEKFIIWFPQRLQRPKDRCVTTIGCDLEPCWLRRGLYQAPPIAPPYISALVKSLAVEVPPSPPMLPKTAEPIVTGEPFPTNQRNRGKLSAIA
jgi:hypothetical protein